MAVPTKDEIQAAIIEFATKTNCKECVYDEASDIYHLVDANGLSLDVGPGLTCKSESFVTALKEIIMDLRGSATVPQEPASAPRRENRPTKTLTPMSERKGEFKALVRPDMPIRDIQVAELTMQDIKDFICPDATDQEAFMFLKLCQARNLNPFTRECYLVKYQGKANMIVGKEAFTRKAELNSQFDGFTAGIIVKKKDGTFAEVPGTFYGDDDVLVGGWADVRRKDRMVHFESRVRLSDYIRKSQSGKTPWDMMPAVMIRKIALVSALREAFPSDLSGCYDRAELVEADEVGA